MDILAKIKTATRADARNWAISPDPEAFLREWLDLRDRPPEIVDLAAAVLEAELGEIVYRMQK